MIWQCLIQITMVINNAFSVCSEYPKDCKQLKNFQFACSAFSKIRWFTEGAMTSTQSLSELTLAETAVALILTTGLLGSKTKHTKFGY